MDRLTCKRCNGIKDGYWSPAKKEELVQRLAEYENTGLEPEEIRRQQDAPVWIPVEERLPEDNKYILLSFDNFSTPLPGRYEEDQEGGAFYLGSCDRPCICQDLLVNAWQPLPEPYRPEN